MTMKEKIIWLRWCQSKIFQELLYEFRRKEEMNASDKQLEQWVLGNSIHNKESDECCPDFSCCNEHTKKDTRKICKGS